MNFHCLFEQSGTFKNVFKAHGHKAWDYDILDDYGQTDYKIDLFREIEFAYANITLGDQNGYEWQRAIFDDMRPDTDFIMAFFPCTYFTGLQQINFRLMSGTNGKPNTCQKNIVRLMEKIKNRAYYFSLWVKFCFICQELKIPTIIENPASVNNYLDLFSPYLPSFVEKDRTNFGDKFIKKTNFYAINFEMKEQFQMFDKNINYVPIKDEARKNGKIAIKTTKLRSEISPKYADNFYKRFLEKRRNKND